MKRNGFLKRPDCGIYYETAGSGPALLFAHRGFTPSSAVPGANAPDAYADDLAALIEELKLDEVRMVAQSMGGWTCLEYALRHPGKGRAASVPRSGHSVYFERPAEFNRIVDEFLQTT